MKTKTFDCVEMKRKAQERRRKELEGMTREELLDHYRRAHEDLLRLKEKLLGKRKSK